MNVGEISGLPSPEGCLWRGASNSLLYMFSNHVRYPWRILRFRGSRSFSCFSIMLIESSVSALSASWLVPGHGKDVVFKCLFR
jgi:hypothetical protein